MINQRDKSGKAHGPWEGYWPNGRLRIRGLFKNGNRHGLFEEFNSNGQIYYKGEYKNGKRRGLAVTSRIK